MQIQTENEEMETFVEWLTRKMVSFVDLIRLEIYYIRRVFFFSSMEKQHFEGMKPLKNKSVRFRCFGYINAAFADRTVGNGCITMENNKRNLLTLS